MEPADLISRKYRLGYISVEMKTEIFNAGNVLLCDLAIKNTKKATR